MMFTFFIFDRKYPFLANFVPKFKVVNLKRNLICRIQWCCLLFSFSIENTVFGQFLIAKFRINCVKWNLELKVIQICRMQWSMFFFLIFDWEYPFWANVVQKFKIFSLSWNLVLRLILICRVQWWCSLFCFWSEIPVLGKFGPKT